MEGLEKQLGREPVGQEWAELRWKRSREEMEEQAEREGKEAVDVVEVGDWEVSGYESHGKLAFALHP